jgi:hypothetical protein
MSCKVSARPILRGLKPRPDIFGCPMRRILLQAVLAVACGGVQTIGRDVLPDGGVRQPCPDGCPADHVCDFDGVCRHWCGSNYPGFVCPTGTACDAADICRVTCDANTGCSNGGFCETYQTANGVVQVCAATRCGAQGICSERYACVAGWCQQIGRLCPEGACQVGQTCQQGRCYVPCGDGYQNTCAVNTSCQNALCQ